MLEVGVEVAVEGGEQGQLAVVVEQQEPGKVNLAGFGQLELDARCADRDDGLEQLGVGGHRRAHRHDDGQRRLHHRDVLRVFKRQLVAAEAPGLVQPQRLAGARVDGAAQAGQAQDVAHGGQHQRVADEGAKAGMQMAPSARVAAVDQRVGAGSGVCVQPLGGGRADGQQQLGAGGQAGHRLAVQRQRDVLDHLARQQCGRRIERQGLLHPGLQLAPGRVAGFGGVGQCAGAGQVVVLQQVVQRNRHAGLHIADGAGDQAGGQHRQLGQGGVTGGLGQLLQQGPIAWGLGLQVQDVVWHLAAQVVAQQCA